MLRLRAGVAEVWKRWWWLVLVYVVVLAFDATTTIVVMKRYGAESELHPAVMLVSGWFGPYVGPIFGAVGKGACALLLACMFVRFAPYIIVLSTIMSAWGGWYNLWGTHLRADQWMDADGRDFGYEKIPQNLIKIYPGMARASVKGHYQAYPLAGMSCAIFEIPKSQKVIIMGGSETTGWLTDNAGFDNQYSFRTIRTTVVSGR